MSQTNRVVRHKTNARKNPHGANHLAGGLRWIVVGVVRQRELRGLNQVRLIDSRLGQCSGMTPEPRGLTVSVVLAIMAL